MQRETKRKLLIMSFALVIAVGIYFSYSMQTRQDFLDLSYSATGIKATLDYWSCSKCLHVIDCRFENDFYLERISYDNTNVTAVVNIPYHSSGYMTKIIDYDELNNKFGPFMDTYVVYCSNGVDSKKLAQEMYSEGFNVVYYMTGGLNEWKRLGYPTEAS